MDCTSYLILIIFPETVFLPHTILTLVLSTLRFILHQSQQGKNETHKSSISYKLGHLSVLSITNTIAVWTDTEKYIGP